MIELYENDFSKHNGKVNSGSILLVFRSIVNQLAKDNNKVVDGCIREGARARELLRAAVERYFDTLLNIMYRGRLVRLT